MQDRSFSKEQMKTQADSRLADAGKIQRIGGVKLDYTNYPGEDFYSDGAIEDTILDIVQNHAPEEFDDIIAGNPSWPVLYHLSRARGNIVDWIPFMGKEKVLEIGAGPGAITGVLSQRCQSVTSVELSQKRSLINAYRHQDADNITILVGNFEDIEPSLDTDYDYIFLIGVLEYAASYIHSQNAEGKANSSDDDRGAAYGPKSAKVAFDPFHIELEKIKAHVKTDANGRLLGRIVIAIENRLGLKYFAGCREDHSGRFFDGIENYENGAHPATTFSRPALERLFADCGLSQYSFYYPYPDYKFMETLYSDRRLPVGTELSDNIRNFDRDRLLLFDEKKAYDGITKDALYPIFSNSYEIVIGPSLPVTYCKFSGDRAPQYRIRTALYEYPAKSLTRAGAADDLEEQPVRREMVRQIRKYPLDAEAAPHVARLVSSYRKLQERFGTQLAPCYPTQDGGMAFAFIPGKTLETLLDEALNRQDAAAFLSWIAGYQRFIRTKEDLPCADYDMTFANIMVNADGWKAIDYEWEVDQPLPAVELLARALVCYERLDPARKEKCEALLGRNWKEAQLGLTESMLEKSAAAEDAFQAKVTGGTISLGALRAKLSAAVIRPSQLQSEEEKEEGRRRNKEKEMEERRQAYEKSKALTGVKIYYDTGKGFNEAQTLEIKQLYGEEGMISFDIPVSPEVRFFRVDPASVPCVVMLREMFIMEYPECGLAVFQRLVRTDGSSCEGGALLYTTSDPWLSWDMNQIRKKLPRKTQHFQRDQACTIHCTLQMTGIPGTMAKAIAAAK